jgi:hypothetical protein
MLLSTEMTAEVLERDSSAADELAISTAELAISTAEVLERDSSAADELAISTAELAISTAEVA